MNSIKKGERMEQIIIRDPIHGQISIFKEEKSIIDSKVFQRLRFIKQVGFSYLVYPGAMHTRFEHSLGTMFLADKFASALDLADSKRRELRIAALVHDIGHRAFSHDSETVIKKLLNLNHEKLGKKIILHSEIADFLNDAGYCPKKISSLAFGEGIGKLISFDTGADRLDYLLRDAYYSGVAYGIIDWQRILTCTKWAYSYPIIEYGGLEAAESVILARFMMFHTVYYHHTIKIARAMFQKALELAIKNKELGLKELEFGDMELLVYLKNTSAAFLINNILDRKLYKRSLVVNWNALSKSQKNYILTDLAKELEDEFYLDAIIISPESFSSNLSLKIEDKNKKIIEIKKLSPLTNSLIKSAANRSNLIVCARNDLKHKVKNFVEKLLTKEK